MSELKYTLINNHHHICFSSEVQRIIYCYKIKAVNQTDIFIDEKSLSAVLDPNPRKTFPRGPETRSRVV